MSGSDGFWRDNARDLEKENAALRARVAELEQAHARLYDENSTLLSQVQTSDTARAEVTRLRETCRAVLSGLEAQATKNQGWTEFMGEIVRLRAALSASDTTEPKT